MLKRQSSVELGEQIDSHGYRVEIGCVVVVGNSDRHVPEAGPAEDVVLQDGRVGSSDLAMDFVVVEIGMGWVIAYEGAG